MIETTSEKNTRSDDQLPENPYIHIGQTLREAREHAKLTKSDVTRQLHLPSSVIDDIEQGQVAQMSAIYRRGYITNYARLLGLDASRLLVDAELDAPPELRQVLPVTQPGWKFERYLRIATYVLVTTVIVPPLLYFFIQGGSRIMEREPVAGTEPVLASESAISGERSGRNSRIALVMDEMQAGRDSTEAGHVSASALPLASVRPVREATEQRDTPGSSTELEAGAEMTPSLSDHGMAELSIVISEDSWVEIHAADGQRLEYDLLRAGQTREYKAQAPFQLLLGRANAVQLILNGKPVTYEGYDRGDVARFELLANGEIL